jgi:acid phosphatase type 7
MYGTDESNTLISTRADAGVSLNDSGTDVAINPSADTYVDTNHATTTYSTTNPLWATSSGTRSFLRFNTNVAVPAGKVITGASLKIYVTNNAVSTGGFEVHPEADTWTESGATWNNQPTLGFNSAGHVEHSNHRQLADN